MASVSISITGLSDTTGLTFGSTEVRSQLDTLSNILQGINNGSLFANGVVINASSTNAVSAQAEVTATTAGSLGTVIGGTTVTTTFTTDQAGTAAKAITDINANTTVNKWVRASAGSSSTKFYVTAVVPGAIGNNITLTVTGTGASATGAGKLIGGTGIDSAPVSFTL